MVFPPGVWAADVEQRYRASSRARRVADESRRRFEAEGVPEAELQACEAEGPTARVSAAVRRSTCRWARVILAPAAGRLTCCGCLRPRLTVVSIGLTPARDAELETEWSADIDPERAFLSRENRSKNDKGEGDEQ